MLGSGAAMAQSEIPTLSAAQRLSCLERPERPPRYPGHGRLDRGRGAMRVLLHFRRADAPPEIEVLLNTAREDMQDEAYRYLRGYRLPCLQPEDGVVDAVQEFSFSNSDRLPAPLPPESRDGQSPGRCVVQPRRDARVHLGYSSVGVEHVLAEARFAGGPDDPPEVRVSFSTGDRRLEDAVREQLAQYRMPCRQAGDRPQTYRQLFSLHPKGVRRFAFSRESYDLAGFLALTRDTPARAAYFDFNTMSCPFKVEYRVWGLGLPNEAWVAGERANPNRQPFLDWLAAQSLDTRSDKQALDLFGSHLQITIPCADMDLRD
ncbi:MAG: hypothetical protein DI603_09955 [Roseateles depolymerans]|uniref:Uncharacterized protein n=1 Tax=Roseateles depolymerans TaxID=76731 RepID=A0A2W5DNP1_9BURK|nr:MAG: hypothetical protein DI603_09955 [Roseateles depolymerans]